MSTLTPSELLMNFKVKYVNFNARADQTIASANKYCEVFSSGSPKNNYGLDEQLEGLTKEGVRIAFDIMNKQIKENPELLKLYDELDDAAINYSKVYAKTNDPFYRSNTEYRKFVDNVIGQCDVAYGQTAGKIKELLKPLVAARLASRKSEVKVKLEKLKEELNKHLKTSKQIRTVDLVKKTLNNDDEEVFIVSKYEQVKDIRELQNLDTKINKAISNADSTLANINVNYFPDMVKYSADQAVNYAVDYRFSRGTRTTKDYEIVKAKSYNPEIDNLIQQINDYAKQNGKPTLPTNPPKKPKR